MEATNDFSSQRFLWRRHRVPLDFRRDGSDVFIFSWHLSLKYMRVGGLFGSRPLGSRRGERKSWCLHVALVTGITSHLTRACPPRKPGFNFPFEMRTGPCCQFRFHWSAVWQIPVPWGHFFCPDYSLTFCAATSPLVWWFWCELKWVAFLLDALPSILKTITLAVISGQGGDAISRETRMWGNPHLPSEILCVLESPLCGWLTQVRGAVV